MLKSGSSPAATAVPATVISVDVRRRVCKVITSEGKFLRNVQMYSSTGDSGRAGEVCLPMPRDRVLVNNSTGSPCIVSGDSAQVISPEYFQYIGQRTGDPVIEFFAKYNLSQGSSDGRRGTSRPEDAIPGDRLFISPGGSILGVLASGSILAKASALAQIFISKLDDMVRIVARNFEVFTDASKRIDASVAGDVFSYTEYYRSLESSRAEKRDYFEAIGNTSSALKSKGEYVGQVASSGNDDVVKYQGVEHEEQRRWTHTLSKVGHSRRVSADTAGNLTEEVFTNNSWAVSVINSAGTNVYTMTTGAATIKVTDPAGQTSKVNLRANGKLSMDSSVSVVVKTPYAHIDAPTIDLGEAPETLQKVVLGDTLASWFASFQTHYVGHSHVDSLGMPTTPPITPMDFSVVTPDGMAYSTRNSTQ